MSEEHAKIENDNGMPVVQAEEQGFRVYIGNLPFTATEEQVREFVAPVGGEIVDVSLPLKFNKRPSGYAFVGYADADAAKKAVDELNEKPFGDRSAHLQLARSKEETAEKRKANKERQAAERATRAMEKKEKALAEGGEATESGESKPKKKRGDRRRRAPGEGDEEAGEGEVNADGEATEKPKRKPRVRKPKQPKEARIDGAEGDEAPAAGEGEAKPKRAKKPRQPKLALTGELSKTSIFVSNLPFTVDDNALAEIFTNLSINVKSAKVVTGFRKPRGEGAGFRGSKGFGFVEVEDASQQQEAVDKVEGTLVGDRTISAKVAKEMKPIEAEAAEAQADVAQATV